MLLPHHAMNVRVTFDRQWSALRVSSDERLYWGIVGADAEDKAIQGATAILSAFTAQQQAAMENVWRRRCAGACRRMCWA